MHTLAISELKEERRQLEESTDLSVFVRTSTDDIVAWDKDKIVEALVRETGLKEEIAGIIAIEVDKQIRAMSVKTITAPLVRELVDVKLLEYGLEEARHLEPRQVAHATAEHQRGNYRCDNDRAEDFHGEASHEDFQRKQRTANRRIVNGSQCRRRCGTNQQTELLG